MNQIDNLNYFNYLATCKTSMIADMTNVCMAGWLAG